MANIGQLKAVFAFNVEPFDSDGDGLPDGWERKVFGGLDRDGSGDFDGDGLSDARNLPWPPPRWHSGWQGNGELGVKAYTVSSTFSEGTGVAQEVFYEGSGGQMESSTATYATQSATMEQMEVRLQTNKDVEVDKPVSRTFVLMKTTTSMDGSATSSSG